MKDADYYEYYKEWPNVSNEIPGKNAVFSRLSLHENLSENRDWWDKTLVIDSLEYILCVHSKSYLRYASTSWSTSLKERHYSHRLIVIPLAAPLWLWSCCFIKSIKVIREKKSGPYFTKMKNFFSFDSFVLQDQQAGHLHIIKWVKRIISRW